jgi:hypothetical protein
MALPTGWAEMGSVDMLGVKTVSTLGFTFQIYPYTNNVGQIINSALENEKINIQYKIVDTTNYDATVNPRATYGDTFGVALYGALRSLAFSPLAPTSSGIYEMGSWVTVGQTSMRVVNVTISPENEKTPDVFNLSLECMVTYAGGYTIEFGKAERKARPLFHDAPWNLPPKITINGSSESFITGSAYGKKNLLNERDITPEKIREGSLSSDYIPIVNTAGEPFTSPIGMNYGVAEIKIDAAFVKDTLPSFPRDIQGKVNSEEGTIVVGGKPVLQCEKGTIALVSFAVTPASWTQKIDWYPGERHPLGWTYAELYQNVSSKLSAKPAINDTNSTLSVEKTYWYFNASASFKYKYIGHGIVVPNRGKNTRDGTKLKPITKNELGRRTEAYLDEKGQVIKDEKKKTFLAFSSYTGGDVHGLLKTLLEVNSSKAIWAKTSDV